MIIHNKKCQNKKHEQVTVYTELCKKWLKATYKMATRKFVTRHKKTGWQVTARFQAELHKD